MLSRFSVRHAATGRLQWSKGRCLHNSNLIRLSSSAAASLKATPSVAETTREIPVPPPAASHSVADSSTPAALKRFWKHAAVSRQSDGFAIELDGRRLKTPGGIQVRIPLDKERLALLTAMEWESQDSILKSFSLPLTSIVMRSLDSLDNEATRQGVIENLLGYVHTDSVCYQQEYPESFVKLQEKFWAPIISIIERKYNLKIVTTEGILRVKQDDSVLKKFREIIEGYDNFTLAAFEKAVLRSKSFLIGLAVVEREIDIDFAATAARLEVLHQIDRWGEVEDSHDLDREDVKRQLGSVVAALV